MAETVSNVSAARPKVGGAIYMAPAGTTMPTDATTALANTFVALGYVSEDGVVNSNSPETDTSKAWGGDVVLTLQTGKEDTFSFTLIEGLNMDVLKLIYGTGNVTGSLAAGISVTATSDEMAAHAFVIEMVMRDNAVKRVCIPNGVITEVGDVTYKDDEIVGYEVTLAALPDANGATHKEYIKRATGGST